MDSADSSPGEGSLGRTRKQTSSELLQAFQSFKPHRQGSLKTPPPPSTPQQAHSPVLTNKEVSKAGMNQSKQNSPSNGRSTQSEKPRKRLSGSPYKEQMEEKESGDSDTPLSQLRKRPRRTGPAPSNKPKTSPEKATNGVHKRVEVQIVQGPIQLENVESSQSEANKCSNKKPTSITPGKFGSPQVLSSETVLTTGNLSINGKQADTPVRYQTPNTVLASTSEQSGKYFATKLLNENQKLAETLSKKNSVFFDSVPAAAESYFEAKLAKVTAEYVKLHQEKVDAIRLEYVAELQKDMDERQKVIDMLLHKS